MEHHIFLLCDEEEKWSRIASKEIIFLKQNNALKNQEKLSEQPISTGTNLKF